MIMNGKIISRRTIGKMLIDDALDIEPFLG